MGTIAEVIPAHPGVRIAVECPMLAADTSVGDSISVSGCCLTVVAHDDSTIEFQAGEETLSRTVLGSWSAGDQANLERALRVGDRLGGHFVSGHVDCVATVNQRMDEEDWSTFWFELPSAWMPHLVSKGCICVDGVSLTVVDVRSSEFSVALIPHTLAETTLGTRAPGDQVNIETDLLAKYVQRGLSWPANQTQ